MNEQHPLSEEFRRLFFILGLCLMLGLMTGTIVGMLVTGIFAFLTWHFIQLARFTRWLMNGKKSAPEVAGGLWGEVYYRNVRLRTKHRKGKQRLARSLKRFRQMTAALPDAVVILNTDTTIEWFNDTAVHLLKLRSTGDIGQRIDNLIRHPEFVTYLKDGDYTEPLRLRSPLNENLILLVYVIPYGSEKRLLVVRDITRLDRLEQVRKDFVANVSHELGTPLTVISGYIEAMTHNEDSPAEARHEALLQMQQQTSRMKNIVDDLLLLSRLEVAEQHAASTEVHVPTLLSDMYAQLIGFAGSRQDVKLIAQDGLTLKGDERELYSAFSNLVTNALKYTPANGQITIKWFIEGDNAVFEVSDTGNGIPEKDIPRLTERFFRVDDSRSRENGGTGLGLAIVKHVLTHHDAYLEISSNLGKGSVFRCVFPGERVVWPVSQSFTDLKTHLAVARPQ
jgi:two-component system phosphate regulon sensor histidine kinase PhoR